MSTALAASRLRGCRALHGARQQHARGPRPAPALPHPDTSARPVFQLANGPDSMTLLDVRCARSWRLRESVSRRARAGRDRAAAPGPGRSAAVVAQQIAAGGADSPARAPASLAAQGRAGGLRGVGLARGQEPVLRRLGPGRRAGAAAPAGESLPGDGQPREQLPTPACLRTPLLPQVERYYHAVLSLEDAITGAPPLSLRPPGLGARAARAHLPQPRLPTRAPSRRRCPPLQAWRRSTRTQTSTSSEGAPPSRGAPATRRALQQRQAASRRCRRCCRRGGEAWQSRAHAPGDGAQPRRAAPGASTSPAGQPVVKWAGRPCMSRCVPVMMCRAWHCAAHHAQAGPGDRAPASAHDRAARSAIFVSRGRPFGDLGGPACCTILHHQRRTGGGAAKLGW
jgi:hypothetical protein